MKQTLILDQLPTDLNRYIAALNSNRHVGNSIKQDDTHYVHWMCINQGLKPMTKKVRVNFYWYVKNKRKDPDNIAFKKSVLDGMVKAGVLKDDGMDEIESFTDHFIIDKQEQLIIDIQEV